MQVLLSLILLATFCFTATATADGPSSCQQKNQLWFACTRDVDCAVIANACGWPAAAANRKHAEAAAACEAKAGAELSCPSYDPRRDGQFKAECFNKACVAKKLSFRIGR